MRRVVTDPNVLISAVIAPHGVPARVLDLWLEGGFERIVSAKPLGELERVLRRGKFRRYATVEEVVAYLGLFRKLATDMADPPREEALTADPGDDYLVALARSIGAGYLVSGDRHLTELQHVVPPVVTPASFLEVLSVA